MNNEAVIISIQYGDVDGDYKCERIVLQGVPHGEGSSFIQQLELIIHYMDDTQLRFKLDFSGYAINLFLGDFLKVGYDQILITGQSGGSGNYTLARLYQLEQNRLKLIVDDEDLSNILQFQVTYQNNGQLGIMSLATGTIFTLNLKGRMIVNPGYNPMPQRMPQPTVSAINTLYPIKQPYSNYYSLQTQQRIIGDVNADMLGMMQSVIELTQVAPAIQSQAIVQFS